MSSAALAKKRRANEPPPPPVTSRMQPEVKPQPMTGLTLPQVIALIDNRLTSLEKSKDKEIMENRLNILEARIALEPSSSSDLDELLQDYQERFSLLATQITDVKDMLMKLQSYTMDVNKMLLEQRSADEEVKTVGDA